MKRPEGKDLKAIFDRQSLNDFFRILGLSLIVIIGTFPENRWTFSPGIDQPLSWVFNHFFETGLSAGKQIVFPHGPLAFFTYPLPENILIASIVSAFLKAIMVFNLVYLFKNSDHLTKWLIPFFTASYFSIVGDFNHLILIDLLLLYSNYYLYYKKGYKIFAFLLTALAFYVKVYVAILSGILFFSFVVYFYIQNRKLKILFIDGLSQLALILAFWFIMYGTLTGFFRYIWGIIQLAKDNSTAVSYYPHNNWYLLGSFILLLLTIFLINRGKKSYYFLILIILSLFAAWKHGMAREDIYHIRGLFVYLISCLAIFLLFYKKNLYINLILTFLMVLLFSLNMRNASNYFSYKYELQSSNNFIEFITNFSELKSRSDKISREKISENKLPVSIIDSIGSSSVDVYPWDYSVIPANELNWQPRIVINSYASYTTWLDKQNANHFDSEKAPEFMIWEFNKVSSDINGGNLNSIDNRYLLNDEPHTIISLLKNYKYWQASGKFLILKKRNEPLSLKNENSGHLLSTWGKWIKVPETTNRLLRAKLKFNKSFRQILKSFFYKDEQFWIYLKTENDLVHKYRIVPNNAADGIWINPYIFNRNKLYQVKEIMFKASNQKILDKKLVVDFEFYKSDNPDYIRDFFNLNSLTHDSVMISSVNRFEQDSISGWKKLSANQFSRDALKGRKSDIVNPNSFSASFSQKLDSIPPGNLKIITDCWIKAPKYKESGKVKLVISIEDEKRMILYKSIRIDDQLIDKDQWNNIYNFADYKHLKKNCVLNVYVWNISNEDVFIDNFRVIIKRDN